MEHSIGTRMMYSQMNFRIGWVCRMAFYCRLHAILCSMAISCIQSCSLILHAIRQHYIAYNHTPCLLPHPPLMNASLPLLFLTSVSTVYLRSAGTVEVVPASLPHHIRAMLALDYGTAVLGHGTLLAPAFTLPTCTHMHLRRSITFLGCVCE